MGEMLQVALCMEGVALGTFLAGVGVFAICPKLPVAFIIPGVCLSGLLEICGICCAIMGIASVLAGVLWWVRHRKEG